MATRKQHKPLSPLPPLSFVALRGDRVRLSALLWNGPASQSLSLCPAAAYELGRELIDCAEQLAADLELLDGLERRLASGGPAPDGGTDRPRTPGAAPAAAGAPRVAAHAAAGVPGYPRPRRIRPNGPVESRR